MTQAELNKLLPKRLKGTKWENLPLGVRISLAVRHAGKVPIIPGHPTPGYRPDRDGPIHHAPPGRPDNAANPR